MGRKRSEATKDLPKYVCLSKAGGIERYVFRPYNKIKKRFEREIPLGPSTISLNEINKQVDLLTRDSVDSKKWVGHLYRTCKKNAKNRNIDFNLTKEDVQVMFDQSNSSCAVTGIKFSEENTDNYKRRPWIPSIDRIDNSQGYSVKNCRLVCAITNIAINEFGVDTLLMISNFMRANRREFTE